MGCNQQYFANTNYQNFKYDCCYDNMNVITSLSIYNEADRFATTNFDNSAKNAFLYNSYSWSITIYYQQSQLSLLT